MQYCNILKISLHVKKRQVFFRHLHRFNFSSGVCFYGKTAERVLSIIATGDHSALFPPSKMFWIIYQKLLFIPLRIRYIKTMLNCYAYIK